MLVDEVQIKIKAGNGGNGVATFHREKFVPRGGPDGGDGGRGGDIYFTAVDNISALNRYRYQKEFSAEPGKPGSKNRKTGLSGKDLVLNVPRGTVIKDLASGEIWEIRDLPAGRQGLEKEVLIAKGGKGGRGNWHFKSSTHQTPMEYEDGKPGQERNLFLELRLIADVGLIGLPSTGKSSLLNELTKANVKVAPYHFTTLEPNLGAMDGLVLADLPGLIEGASNGKGLGIKFLKHVKRTKVLVHCISTESTDPLRDYETIRKELGEYDPELLQKPEIILLTKSDLVSEKEIKEILKKLKKTSAVAEAMADKEILPVSIHDYDSLENLRKRLINQTF